MLDIFEERIARLTDENTMLSRELINLRNENRKLKRSLDKLVDSNKEKPKNSVIYLVDVSVTSLDDNRKSWWSRAFDDGVRAFDYVQEMLDAEDPGVEWNLSFEGRSISEVIIEGMGKFPICHDDDPELEEGIMTIKVKEIAFTSGKNPKIKPHEEHTP